MTVPQRFGITVPFEGVSLQRAPVLVRRARAARLTRMSGRPKQVGTDAFTPLALAAAWAPRLRLGTAIVPVYTRGAATLAQSVAAMCQAAPGRFALGIGTSSDVIVEQWNGMRFERPMQRVRDTITFLRAALSGEKVTADYETFSVKGFRLGAACPRAAADPRRRVCDPRMLAAGGHRRRRSHHQLALGRRREDGGPPRRRGQGDRREDLRAPEYRS